MTQTHDFQDLLPFEKKTFGFRLSAAAEIVASRLNVIFRIQEDDSDILFSKILSSPKRCDNLWQKTCFEVFLQNSGSDAYWEFNFSPSGDWAVYRFSGYRLNLQIEERIQFIDRKTQSDSLTSRHWIFIADLRHIPELKKNSLRLGFSSVIEHKNSEKSHWALRHDGTKPDFHLPQSFCHTLNGDIKS